MLTAVTAESTVASPVISTTSVCGECSRIGPDQRRAVAIGQPHVHQHQVELPLLDPGQGVGGPGGHLGLDRERLQDLGDVLGQRDVVVNDQDSSRVRHARQPWSPTPAGARAGRASPAEPRRASEPERLRSSSRVCPETNSSLIPGSRALRRPRQLDPGTVGQHEVDDGRARPGARRQGRRHAAGDAGLQAGRGQGLGQVLGQGVVVLDHQDDALVVAQSLHQAAATGGGPPAWP